MTKCWWFWPAISIFIDSSLYSRHSKQAIEKGTIYTSMYTYWHASDRHAYPSPLKTESRVNARLSAFLLALSLLILECYDTRDEIYIYGINGKICSSELPVRLITRTHLLLNKASLNDYIHGLFTVPKWYLFHSFCVPLGWSVSNTQRQLFCVV